MPWLDAAWAEPGWREAPLPFDPTDRGLLLGDGVFDTALVVGGRMVWRAFHLDRLAAACASLGYPVAAARLNAAVAAVLARFAEGSVRITVTHGPGPRGLAPPTDPYPTVLATGAPLNRAAIGAPLRLATSLIRRNETSPLARVKGLNYADAVLAAAAAREAGSDDALFLNGRGHVACTTVGNLFAIRGDELATPPLADGVVPGTVRAILLDGAGALGLRPVERSLVPADLATADAVVITNSLRLAAPVLAIDGREVASRDELADRLRRFVVARAAEAAGVDPQVIAA